jgi:hypothetical protein
MVDCSQFRALLPDLDRPGVLPVEVRDQALLHAEVCGACGQLLTESESLDAELRRLIVKDGHSRAAVSVEENLLRAFRDKKAAAARQTVGQFAALIGIAAMLLLSLGLWLYRRAEMRVGSPAVSPVTEPGPKQANAQVRDQSENDQLPQVARQSLPQANERRGEVSKSTRSARNAQQASYGAKQNASEDASAFIPLPDADYPATLDDGAVVRVEMPRTDLAAFGLPVEAMEGDGTVRADLIVSADGTPQAIRLVDGSVAQR